MKVMIDEKKIEEAAEEQLENLGAYGLDEVDLGKEHQVTLYREEDVKAMFMAGINWFLDNLWHKASEEPKETDKSLLCQCSNGEYITHPFKPTLGEWHERCEFVGITRWLYIEDLMKGGK